MSAVMFIALLFALVAAALAVFVVRLVIDDYREHRRRMRSYDQILAALEAASRTPSTDTTEKGPQP